MHMVSVFFADTVNAKARQTSTMTSIIIASPCAIARLCRHHSRTACPHRTNVVHSRLRSHRRRRFLQVHQLDEDGPILAESLEDNGQHGCEEDVNNSGDSTYPCHTPCSTSNQSEQMPSSGRTQALIPSWSCWMTAIICGGTPMRVSTCHRRVPSTVSYAFWRSMKHMKRDTPASRPVSCSLRTINIMSMVERSGRNPHCSSGNSPFASQLALGLLATILSRTLPACDTSEMRR